MEESNPNEKKGGIKDVNRITFPDEKRIFSVIFLFFRTHVLGLFLG